MNKNKVADIIIVVGCVILFTILKPLLKSLSSVLLVLAALFLIKALIDSKQIKKEIQQDPNKYYNSQKGTTKDD